MAIMRSNTQDIGEAMIEVIKGKDVGLVISVLAQITKHVFDQVDRNIPEMSEQARKDFYETLNGKVN